MFKRGQTEEERLSIELSASFRDVEKLYAWKYLMGEMLIQKSKAVDDIDKLPIDELTVQRIAQARGIRKCVDALMKKIEYAREGI